MASDTAPAAVPDPVGQPATDTSTGPATGPGTGLLAPIEPARPTSAAFNLDPSAIAPAGTVDQAPASASSSTYQNDDTTDAKDGKNSSKQQTGVMRAFALAAIERWKKGADARNKRLDIQKAKASAHQTKESRTVNRSEKFAGGSTNSGTASGKSLDSKTQKGAGGSGKGASKNGSQKNGGSKNGSSGNGSGGGSPSGGRSGSGGGSGSGGPSGGRGSSGASGHGASGNSNSGASPKKSKSDSKGHTESSRTGADGKKNSGKNNAGTKTDTATCGDSSGISLTKDKKSKNHDSKSDARKNGRTDTADAKGSSKDTTSGRTSNGKGTDRASAKPSSADDAKSGTAPKKVDLEKKDTKTGKTRKSSKGDKPAKDGTTAPKDGTSPATSGTPINTQPSREAGYRDGSRTAKATAHVKAYRDGFKDGHHDTSEAAEREKRRLDEAHEARKQQRAKDQPVTASSADHQPQGPQPIDVKEVTDTHVTLDGGKTYTRGEVRNLKQYERRMAEKATNMGKAAEGTRQLEAHAEQQADKALKFLEMAKTVEGGDRFVGILTRLHEAATIQIREAQELHKRVVRAADNTRVVLVNVEIRYGGIYKAVCESPLTKPAELNWYRK
jgi:hypothetical protein